MYVRAYTCMCMIALYKTCIDPSHGLPPPLFPVGEHKNTRYCMYEICIIYYVTPSMMKISHCQLYSVVKYRQLLKSIPASTVAHILCMWFIIIFRY